MSYGERVFIFHENGRVERVAVRKFKDLWWRRRPWPEYAGKVLRIAHVMLNLNNRRPVNIHKIWGFRIYLDEQGYLNEREWAKQLALIARVMDEAGASQTRGPTVYDAEPVFARRVLDHRYHWFLTPKEINQVIDLIWKKPTR